jgi:hypothetical protein
MLCKMKIINKYKNINNKKMCYNHMQFNNNNK